MRFAEPIAALRGIPVYLISTAGSVMTGVVPTGSQLQISKSGDGWGNGAGTWTELGHGAYLYQATLLETTTSSFVLLRVAVAGALPYVLSTEIGVRIAPTAAAAERRVPIYLVNASGAPVTGVDISSVAADTLVSVAGGAFAPGAGSLVEIGFGAYYYELAATELVPGVGVLRMIDAAHGLTQPYVYSWDVLAAGPPASIVLPPLEVPPDVAIESPVIDHITEAIARLPHQFIGSAGR